MLPLPFCSYSSSSKRDPLDGAGDDDADIGEMVAKNGLAMVEIDKCEDFDGRAVGFDERSGVVLLLGDESAAKIDEDTSEMSNEARFCDFVNL